MGGITPKFTYNTDLTLSAEPSFQWESEPKVMVHVRTEGGGLTARCTTDQALEHAENVLAARKEALDGFAAKEEKERIEAMEREIADVRAAKHRQVATAEFRPSQRAGHSHDGERVEVWREGDVLTAHFDDGLIEVVQPAELTDVDLIDGESLTI